MFWWYYPPQNKDPKAPTLLWLQVTTLPRSCCRSRSYCC